LTPGPIRQLAFGNLGNLGNLGNPRHCAADFAHIAKKTPKSLS
jgi:hypothetical protein